MTAGDRLAAALRRLRWPVVAAWVLVVVLLSPAASGLSKVTNGTVSAFLPASSQSARVAILESAAQHATGRPASQQAIVVFARGGGLTAGDLAAVDRAHAAVHGLLGSVAGLGVPGPVERSADGDAALFTISVSAPQTSLTSSVSRAVTSIRHAVKPPARLADGGLRAAVTGSAAVDADSGTTTLTALLLSAVVIVALILLLVYRSPILWLLPLISAAGAVQVARAAAHGLAATGLTVSFLASAILIVLVFGAASDYALLLIHRYREELQHHTVCEDAMAAALRATLPTLLASAATVTGAMLCLLLARSASLYGLGLIGAVAIAAALAAETTLLPALLLILGRAALWPGIRQKSGAAAGQSRLWAAIGSRIAPHPARVVLGTVLLLGLACTGLTSLRSTDNPLSDLKGHPGSITGEQILTAHYPAGAIAPLIVLAPHPKALAAAQAAHATPGVASVTADPPVGGYSSDAVTMSVPPYSARAAAVIAALRSRLARSAPGSLVGGDPAAESDITEAARHDTTVLIPVVLAVILIVISVLLRALVAPLVLVATTALSFGASFGLSSLAWRYWFGYPGIDAQIPLYIFIFLIALGIDYNIFLSARIREESRHLSTRQGTLRGLTVTGGVITAAGAILAATFAALAQLPSVSVTEVGTAITFGVLLDALLVRTILVPATFLAIGNKAWWPSRAAAPYQAENADHDAPDNARSRQHHASGSADLR